MLMQQQGKQRKYCAEREKGISVIQPNWILMNYPTVSICSCFYANRHLTYFYAEGTGRSLYGW